jgi:hypothetical protein
MHGTACRSRSSHKSLSQRVMRSGGHAHPTIRLDRKLFPARPRPVRRARQRNTCPPCADDRCHSQRSPGPGSPSPSIAAGPGDRRPLTRQVCNRQRNVAFGHGLILASSGSRSVSATGERSATVRTDRSRARRRSGTAPAVGVPQRGHSSRPERRSRVIAWGPAGDVRQRTAPAPRWSSSRAPP